MHHGRNGTINRKGYIEMDVSFYKGKRVLVTGHTGFKGSWLCRILIKAGAEVTGYSLEPPTDTGSVLIGGSGTAYEFSDRRYP